MSKLDPRQTIITPADDISWERYAGARAQSLEQATLAVSLRASSPELVRRRVGRRA
jgi:hypothetical protein